MNEIWKKSIKMNFLGGRNSFHFAKTNKKTLRHTVVHCARVIVWIRGMCPHAVHGSRDLELMVIFQWSRTRPYAIVTHYRSQKLQIPPTSVSRALWRSYCQFWSIETALLDHCDRGEAALRLTAECWYLEKVCPSKNHQRFCNPVGEFSLFVWVPAVKSEYRTS